MVINITNNSDVRLCVECVVQFVGLRAREVEVAWKDVGMCTYCRSVFWFGLIFSVWNCVERTKMEFTVCLEFLTNSYSIETYNAN